MTAPVPYLAVRDARAAMAWYADALGARVVGDPYVMDDNRIGHAELTSQAPRSTSPTSTPSWGWRVRTRAASASPCT